jgi:hypothetical protein
MGETNKNGTCLRDVLAHLTTNRVVRDDDFDQIYSAFAQRLSTRHWTPVDVARRAAKHLIVSPGSRVLDIGSGVGKFCIVGALTTPGTFVGIEQREPLFAEGQRVCRQYDIPRVEFIHGNMIDLEWGTFDGFYLFNPFLENLITFSPIDKSVPVSSELYDSYVDVVRKKLASVPIGTRVATYHGFGGKLPDGFELNVKEQIGSDRLLIWVKVRQTESKSTSNFAAVARGLSRMTNKR